MRTIVVLLLAFGIARADVRGDPEGARPYVASADTAYKLGKFADALADYAKAYELYPSPALLFNLGQCHRYLKNWERAVFFYQGFLREMPATEPNRAVVEDLLREVRAQLAQEQAAIDERRRADEAARAKAAVEAARIKAANDAVIEAERAKVQRETDRLARDERMRRERLALEEQRRRDEEARRPVYKKWWFWSAVGGVVAAAGAGTAYYFSGSTTLVDPSGSLGGIDRR